jgi:flagellar biosynthesis/type III secretory pathway protein FliH
MIEEGFVGMLLLITNVFWILVVLELTRTKEVLVRNPKESLLSADKSLGKTTMEKPLGKNEIETDECGLLGFEEWEATRKHRAAIYAAGVRDGIEQGKKEALEMIRKKCNNIAKVKQVCSIYTFIEKELSK